MSMALQGEHAARQSAVWDQGMRGGPVPVERTAEPIPAELARAFLQVRYASLLPGTVSNEVVGRLLFGSGAPVDRAVALRRHGAQAGQRISSAIR